MSKFLIVVAILLCRVGLTNGQEAVSTSTNSHSSAPTSNPSPSPAGSPTSTGQPATAQNVVVTSEELDISREQIVPSLGATRYTVGPDRLDSQAQGENAGFNQTVLRFPGVAEDSFGQLHVRGEHANLQYRIDDVLLPESIPGFGQELQTRFADNISLITGALPAQFGFRTTGVIDVHTKNGTVFTGNEASVYVGSFDTVQESFERGGLVGQLSYYLSETYLHDGIGVENPTRSANPLHDDTDQEKYLNYLSYIIDDSSRVTLLVGANHGDFEIPNNPGQLPVFNDQGRTNFNSAKLDENQAETNSYEILTYQKKVDDLNFQVSAFNRYSSILFTPDKVGDLIFNGVASRLDRDVLSNGFEINSSYKLNDEHTIRGGFIFNEQYATANTVTLVFPVDCMGNVCTTPSRVVDNNNKYGYFYGFYLQDEWKPFEQLTINFGGRLDFENAFRDENQLSPRLSIVYKPFTGTTLHLGYARYFTPPPLEAVPESTLAKFAGTTNAPAIMRDSLISAERAHYFDAGLTQQIMEGWTAGIDGFYKSSHSLIDEGQFGAALVQSAFNYERGRQYGGEFTTNYDHGPFSAYGNVGWVWARGIGPDSAEFLWDPAEFKFAQHHWIFLDHDQRITASVGGSYTWEDWKGALDLLYGSGLHRGFANTKTVPSYATLNLSLQRRFEIKKIGTFKVRFDVVNLLDHIYELRDGSGVGVGAPQFGQRRGFYATIAYDF